MYIHMYATYAKSLRALRALSLLIGATKGRACSTTANCSTMSTSFNLRK